MGRPARAVGGAVTVVVAVALLAAAISLLQQDERAQSAAPGAAEPATTPSAPSSPVATPAPTGPELLLPNLRSLAASDLQIEVAGGDRLLRFSASLANVGDGPLLVEPLMSARCAGSSVGAEQLLHADRDEDGRFERARDPVEQRRFAGCMLDHPTHDHWHFDAMAAYTLRRSLAERPLVSRDKVSFCLRDNEQVRGQPVVVPREHFGECTRNGPQGISPGWVDIYTYELDGQSLRLPDAVRSGRLCLELVSDPLSRLRESDETDNATAIGIEISGTSVRRADDVLCAPPPVPPPVPPTRN